MFKVLRQSFCCTAIPDVLWSDGRPQFTAKSFQDFLRKWGVTHCTSSPYYPKSNSKIKAIVKSIKKIITASRDTRTLNENRFCHVLLQYQNTLSCRDGISPALKLFNRPIQDTIPAHRCLFAPEWQHSALEAEQQDACTLQQSESFYNNHAHNLADI